MMHIDDRRMGVLEKKNAGISWILDGAFVTGNIQK